MDEAALKRSAIKKETALFLFVIYDEGGVPIMLQHRLYSHLDLHRDHQNDLSDRRILVVKLFRLCPYQALR